MSNENDVESFVMPTDPAQLKELRGIFYEMSGCLQRAKDMRSSFNDLALSIEEKFKIPKKVAARMGRTFHKGDFKDQEHEDTIFGEVYTRVFTKEEEQGN